jgi:hypothetical protein
MEIRIVIDAPRGWKRRILFFVVTPVAMIAAVALVARATVQNVDGTWVTSGGPVSAASLTSDLNAINANFTSVDQRLAAVETFQSQATHAGAYSLGAVYCGRTVNTEGTISSGTASGYAAAKAQCASITGCSASAHMCTTEEMVRSGQLGVSIPTANAWISAGMIVQGTLDNDCNGWTSNAMTYIGSVWAGGTPQANYCNTPLPIACCD